MVAGTGVLGADALFERDDQLRVMDAALGSAEVGDGSMLLIEGPAGIGKTRLLARARELGAERGWGVLSASGGEFESRFPFGVARQLFEPIVRAFEVEMGGGGDAPWRVALDLMGSGLVFRRPAAPDPSAEYSLMHGLYWLTADVTSMRGPLVMTVEDAHWADAASVRTLAYFARRLDGLPIVVAIAVREGESREVAATLNALRREPLVRRLELAPLSHGATRDLIESLAAERVDGGAVTACHAVTGGNPFLITELVRAAEMERMELTAEAVRGLQEIAPDSIARAVVLRLGALSADAVLVARALVVLGSESSLGFLGDLAGLKAKRTAMVVRQLVDAGVLARGELAFVHPLVRAAVHADISAAELGELHDGAYELLKGRTDTEQLARHLMSCPPRGDFGRAEVLRAAAGLARSREGHASALALLHRAVAEQPADRGTADLNLELGIAALHTRDLNVAVEHLGRALEALEDPDARVEAALGLAAALSARGDHREAVGVLKRAEAGLDEEQRLRLQVEGTTLGTYVGELAGAARERMRAHASLPGDSPAQRIALANAALEFGFDRSSTAAEVVSIARRALADGSLIREQGGDAPVIAHACYMLMFAGELQLADETIRDMRAEARARGSSGAVLGFGSCIVALERGELAAAVANGEAAWRVTVELPDTAQAERWRIGIARVLCEALIEHGDIASATRVVADAAAGITRESRRHVLLRHANGLLAAAREDWRTALEAYVGLGAILDRFAIEERTTRWRLEAAKAAAALGESDQAVALSDEELRIAERWGAPGGLGLAQSVRALVGPANEALVGLETAVATLRGSPNRLALASALVYLGVARRRANQRIDSREALKEGLDLATACGARPLAERARAELKISGARPRRDRITGRDALTASEQRIAELAAGGRTNRQIAQELFLTPKTVEQHLSSVYRKLDVTGRANLAPALGELVP